MKESLGCLATNLSLGFQNSPEVLDHDFDVRVLWSRDNHLAVKSAVRTFVIVILEVFIFHITQLRLAGQDEMVQPLLLDVLDERFHIDVQLERMRRESLIPHSEILNVQVEARWR